MFFRKIKTVTLPIIGVLDCDKNFIFGSSYSWIGGVKVLNNKETFIAVDGDKNNPNFNQVMEINDIILNFDTVYKKQINYWLGLESLGTQEKFENWEVTYFLGMITPGNNSILEITIEPINENDLGFFSIEIENKRVIKLDV